MTNKVVPVSNGTWKVAEPFKGAIIDDVVYGRGALDDKGSVMVNFTVLKAFPRFKMILLSST